MPVCGQRRKKVRTVGLIIYQYCIPIPLLDFNLEVYGSSYEPSKFVAWQ